MWIIAVVWPLTLVAVLLLGIALALPMGKTRGRAEIILNGALAIDCAHVWGRWEPTQRHTATTHSEYGLGRKEVFTPVLRRTCELCQWQEHRKVPLT